MGRVLYFAWEVTLMQALQQFGGMFGKYLAIFFTSFGEQLVMIAILGVIYWGFNKEWAKRIAVNFIAGLLFGSMLKNVVRRRRPYLDHEGIDCLKPAEKDFPVDDAVGQGFSFPSLHSTNAVSLYGTLSRLIHKRWYTIASTALILLVGLSRVFLGVHYPTDVIAGWLLGFAVMMLLSKAQDRCKNRLMLTGLLTLIALPGWFFCASNDFYTTYGLLIGMQLSFWADDRWVHFENTRSIPRVILRTVGGVVVFLILNGLLKIVLPEALTMGNAFAEHLLRAVRYALVSFAAMGLYPMVFRYTAKIGRK